MSDPVAGKLNGILYLKFTFPTDNDPGIGALAAHGSIKRRLGGNDRSCLQAGKRDAAIFISPINTVVGSDEGAAAVGNQELNPSQGLVLGACYQLLDGKCRAGSVVHGKGLGIRRIYLNGLGLGGRVNGVSGQTLYLFHHDSTYNGDTNLPGVVGLEPPLSWTDAQRHRPQSCRPRRSAQIQRLPAAAL